MSTSPPHHSTDHPVLDHHSTARVATSSPSRYGRQLVDHMTRKIQAEWNDTTSTGRLAFDLDGPVTGVVDLTCEADTLVMALSAAKDEQERLEQVVGSHLARFGYRDGLAVSWTRQDGSAGTTQGPLSEEDVERLSRRR
ncbi:DUF2218 domain-containing protein [Actinomyces sp. 2119]|uniref:DUF2218 domain-containing protein n=1 Tax=Actinomyces lilanjuaniae TaxID=2321394 RepID=A0ABM6Z5C3_9ACTO|nr:MULTISPECIES: DUF2218 domain-containing protein [Actinomyces]AYD90530.1 DUF2218 domain-containing protein [Actinomyces lilanjuaniae]RJF44018.1 DUF2218 domain-containing protein [Actinomyces sp. 2119]